MNLRLSDPVFQKYLKVPLVALIIAVVTLASADFLLKAFEEENAVLLRKKTRHLDKVVKEVRFLKYQENLFFKYGDKYQTFIQKGLVNEQDRVKWTDELLKIKQRLALTNFALQFEPEQKLNKTDLMHLKMTKDIFYYTNLNISAGLYTGLDIIAMLSGISEQVSPLYLVKKCSLKGDLEQLNLATFDSLKPNIMAKCTLVLFQAKPRNFEVKS